MSKKLFVVAMYDALSIPLTQVLIESENKTRALVKGINQINQADIDFSECDDHDDVEDLISNYFDGEVHVIEINSELDKL